MITSETAFEQSTIDQLMSYDPVVAGISRLFSHFSIGAKWRKEMNLNPGLAQLRTRKRHM